jgi:spermidine synthase
MSQAKKLHWLDFESPWACQPGKVRVRQSAEGVTRDELSNRAWRDELTQPYIFETLYERRMHFTNQATQSAMLLADPDALISQYTRKMMSFLLFNPTPAHIVMIGLGGGSLAKFCYRHLPRSRITVVEIKDEVIEIREEF